MTHEDVTRAVSNLRKTDRGTRALKDFRTLIDNGTLSLDSRGKAALIVLMQAAFTTLPGTVLEQTAEDFHEE